MATTNLRRSFVLCGVVLLAGQGFAAANDRTDLAKRFQSHIDYLASDELGGRGVGTEGIERASRYIAAQFARIGLTPAGDDGTFFQTFELALERTLTDDSWLSFGGDIAKCKLRTDFIPFPFSSDETFTGKLVFCGFGIDAKEHEHDDFVHADLKGNIALILRGEPSSWANENGEQTQHALLRNKVYNAKDRGAVGVILVNSAPEAGEKDRLQSFNAHGADAYGVPALNITRALADKLLKRAGKDSLTKLESKMEKDGYVTSTLKGIKVDGKVAFETRNAPTRNVVAWLGGEGPLANEYVVIGAHYDHLGTVKPNARKFKDGKLVRIESGPKIHNGADDNASGTSGLIEIAELFAKGKKPKRSVLFIAFTAEESGLHGSKRWVEHPTKPIKDAIAMLNMDMIGRLPEDDNTVEVFGVGCGSSFAKIVDRRAPALDLKIAPSPETGGRSDHAPFIRAEIPAMHFFSGQHSDYHKPSDDSELINEAGGARITMLVHQIANDLAMSNDRPSFQKGTTKAPDDGSRITTFRVVMGLAPSYGDDGKAGMKVDAVSADGPADVAGMKKGDRIIFIGDKKVANVYDYMAATRKNKAGDTVMVKVVRGGKEHLLKVQLSAAK